ncbi:hypothetical protein C9374_009158 [Naegleria lovaniensis]|uniref:Uncharacterized protein n=1 Tax=Naegleria lovaniensis TaxID=51637 RepID=A0AA88GHU3_NAELO|nr:uncharacterized protein C9374_009158 [Naegleria lovaniensis]KAG2377642.1 hypothetical protein C9374_009158 [Naegleria lovaniensis]
MNRLSQTSRFSFLLRTLHQQQQALSFHTALNFNRIGSIFDVPSEDSKSDDNAIFKSLTKTIDEGVIPSQHQPQGRRAQKANKQQNQQLNAGSKIMRHIFEELQNSEAQQQQQAASSTSDSTVDKHAFDSFLFGDSKADMSSLQSLMQQQGTANIAEEYFCGEKIAHQDPVTKEQFIKGKVKLISEALAKVSAEQIEALSSQTLKMVELLRGTKENSEVSEIEKVFLSIEKPTSTDFNLMAKAYSKDVSQRVGLKHALDKQLQSPQSFGSVLMQAFAKLGEVENMQQLVDDGTVNRDAIAYIFLLKNLKEARASFEVLKQFYESVPQEMKEEGSFIYESLKREEQIHSMEQVLMKEGPPLESTYFNPYVTPVYGFNRPYPKK